MNNSKDSDVNVINVDPDNDNCDQLENISGVMGQWKWSEDILLINAWLNVPVDLKADNSQKGDAFWNRIGQYCEQSNSGLIKRGVVAMRKRWHRITEGAKRYGWCHEQAERKLGSDSNLDNIVELAHEIHKSKFEKKCNFDKHWSKLRKQPKWITHLMNSGSSGSTKRIKLNENGTYTLSVNNEIQTDEHIMERGEHIVERGEHIVERDEHIVESLISSKDTAVAENKEKETSKTKEFDEPEELKSSTCRRLSVMEQFNINWQRELDFKIVMADTSIMNETQLEIHAKMLDEIRSRKM